MRRSYLVALSLLGTAPLFPALAHADDVSARDWSGAYLGASLGAAESKARTSTHATVGAPGDYFTTTDPQQLGDAGRGRLSQGSGSGGLFGGYGVQQGTVYWGVEGSLNRLGFDDVHRPATQTYLSDPTATFTLRQSVKSDWQGTLRGRLGLAQDRWLAYVTGGVALARIELSSNYVDTSGLGGRGNGSNAQTKAGWVLGLGGEYALSKRLSLRVEYLLADYGSVNNTITVTNPTFGALSSTLRDKVDLKTQTLSLGLAYRF